jgi:hypothetical protein
MQQEGQQRQRKSAAEDVRQANDHRRPRPPSPIMSSSVSCTASPCENPLAQLLPAPPPSLLMKMFSGLKRLRMSEVWMPLMTLCVFWGWVGVPVGASMSRTAFRRLSIGQSQLPRLLHTAPLKLRSPRVADAPAPAPAPAPAGAAPPRLEVQQQRPRDVVLVVRLVEEDVLAVAALRALYVCVPYDAIGSR